MTTINFIADKLTLSKIKLFKLNFTYLEVTINEAREKTFACIQPEEKIHITLYSYLFKVANQAAERAHQGQSEACEPLTTLQPLDLTPRPPLIFFHFMFHFMYHVFEDIQARVVTWQVCGGCAGG